MPRLLSYVINLQRKVFFVPLNQRLYIFSLTHSSKFAISSKVLGDVDKVILDQNTDGGQGVVPYLPLNQLRTGSNN